MPTITFRTKPETVYNMDDTPAYVEVKVPQVTTRHCDMHAFHTHPRYGNYTNSVLFVPMLRRDLAARGVTMGGTLRLDQLPEGVVVDTSGFLAQVTITLD